MPGLRECRTGGFAQNGATTPDEIFVLVLVAELVQVLGIAVFGEETKQHAARVNERRRILVPSVLEQATHGVDRSNALEAVGPRRGQRQHRVIPRSVHALLEGQQHRGSVRIRKRGYSFARLYT